jgi:hypothetical protein
MTMDSSVYRYLIEELQSLPDASFSSLPVHFIKSPVAGSKVAMECLRSFLLSLAGPSDPHGPAVLLHAQGFFSRLFANAHNALLEILTGADPQTHPFRHDGTELLRFLTYCATQEKALSKEAADCAMFCFLLEGLMHAGWCPNTCEGEAKYAAHEYFARLKKNLHCVQTTRGGQILGYLWGTWLLGQKTEGIRDKFREEVYPNASFEFLAGDVRRIYLAKTSIKPPLFYIVEKYNGYVAHPFDLLCHDQKLGLSVSVNNEAVVPSALLESTEINRQKMKGDRIVYGCVAGAINDVRWTVVLLSLEITMYRIDILKLPEEMPVETVQAAMRFSCETEPVLLKKDVYIAKGKENTIFHFKENTFSLRYSHQERDGISVFASEDTDGNHQRDFTCVTAWAKGKGITAVNETKLLGMYE